MKCANLEKIILFCFSLFQPTIIIFFIIHAAKTLSIGFVFYGETPIYQNRDETSLDCTKKVVFLTLVSKNMSVHVL